MQHSGFNHWEAERIRSDRSLDARCDACWLQGGKGGSATAAGGRAHGQVPLQVSPVLGCSAAWRPTVHIRQPLPALLPT
jgi:hypothetical protein